MIHFLNYYSPKVSPLRRIPVHRLFATKNLYFQQKYQEMNQDGALSLSLFILRGLFPSPPLTPSRSHCSQLVPSHSPHSMSLPMINVGKKYVILFFGVPSTSRGERVLCTSLTLLPACSLSLPLLPLAPLTPLLLPLLLSCSPHSLSQWWGPLKIL